MREKQFIEQFPFQFDPTTELDELSEAPNHLRTEQMSLHGGGEVVWPKVAAEEEQVVVREEEEGTAELVQL